jgi:hypothetical protein
LAVGGCQLAAELVRAKLGEQCLLVFLLRHFLRLAADDQPPWFDADFDFVGGESGDFGAHDNMAIDFLDLDRDTAHQLRFGAKPVFKVVAEFAPARLEVIVSASRHGLRKLLHLFEELFGFDEYRAGRNILFRGLHGLLRFHSLFSSFEWCDFAHHATKK